MEIEGKTAVVTGGGNGIGRAIVLALAERGMHVAVVDVERQAAAQAPRYDGDDRYDVNNVFRRLQAG